MKFSIEDFFSKCDQIPRKLRIWSHLLKKSLLENFIFRAVTLTIFAKKCLTGFCKHLCYYSYSSWLFYIFPVFQQLRLFSSIQ